VHPSAQRAMRSCIDEFMPAGQHYKVVDFGSKVAAGHSTHRDLLADRDCTILGVDILEGPNVDLVMKKPYTLPVASNSADVVMSGQVLEHVPFFLTSILELHRILRPGGLLMITVPSRGHRHNVYDCWRFYPDSMRAIAAFGAFTLESAGTDLPPKNERGRYDYANAKSYWGDTYGVFRKTAKTPLKLAVAREAMKAWSNSVGDLENHPLPLTR